MGFGEQCWTVVLDVFSPFRISLYCPGKPCLYVTLQCNGLKILQHQSSICQKQKPEEELIQTDSFKQLSEIEKGCMKLGGSVLLLRCTLGFVVHFILKLSTSTYLHQIFSNVLLKCTDDSFKVHGDPSHGPSCFQNNK